MDEKTAHTDFSQPFLPSLDGLDSRTADQYVDDLVGFLAQNRNFDNFLDEVSKLEKFEEFSGPADGGSSTGSSCEFTLEYNEDGELLKTGRDDALKQRINSRIIKALESFPLDDVLEEDIANIIAGSLQEPQISEISESALEYVGEEAEGNDEPVVRPLKPKKKRTGTKTASQPSQSPQHAQPVQNRGDPNSTWTCEFCEYEQVYGEKPLQLIRWFNSRLEEQEDRGSIQRRRVRRDKARKKSEAKSTPPAVSQPSNVRPSSDDVVHI